jgi:hypothetical protein
MLARYFSLSDWLLGCFLVKVVNPQGAALKKIGGPGFQLLKYILIFPGAIIREKSLGKRLKNHL